MKNPEQRTRCPGSPQNIAVGANLGCIQTSAIPGTTMNIVLTVLRRLKDSTDMLMCQ
jgi:hypothetical protein